MRLPALAKLQCALSIGPSKRFHVCRHASSSSTIADLEAPLEGRKLIRVGSWHSGERLGLGACTPNKLPQQLFRVGRPLCVASPHSLPSSPPFVYPCRRTFGTFRQTPTTWTDGRTLVHTRCDNALLYSVQGAPRAHRKANKLLLDLHLEIIPSDAMQ